MSNLWKVVQIFAVIGVILAVYLLWQLFLKPDFHPCNINSTINCNALTAGPLSYTLGIPTALYGLLGYIGIFIAARLKAKKWLLGIALFGLAFCLRLAFIELVQLRVICPVCIGCQIVMIGVNILAFLLLFHKKTEPKTV